MKLNHSQRLMFVELNSIMGYSRIESLRIICWEENIGEREYIDKTLKLESDTLAKSQEARDWALELKVRERSVRKSTEQHGIRYMVPMVRSEIVGWLRENYDAGAKGPRFAQQQKMLDLVVKALPEEREAGGTMLADLLASLASRVIDSRIPLPGEDPPQSASDDEGEPEIRFQ